MVGKLGKRWASGTGWGGEPTLTRCRDGGGPTMWGVGREAGVGMWVVVFGDHELKSCVWISVAFRHGNVSQKRCVGVWVGQWDEAGSGFFHPCVANGPKPSLLLSWLDWHVRYFFFFFSNFKRRRWDLIKVFTKLIFFIYSMDHQSS